MFIHKKILLVDDDEDDRMFFTDALAELEPRLQCSTAENGHMALDYLAEVQPLPTLIFMDINMPFMNGFECLAQIRKNERYKHIPVVILTTVGDEETRFKAQQMGADYFLTKASDYKVMKAQMHSVLKRNFATA